MSEVRRATGPGRVNLIGDHTDYNQGLALPMAIGLGVTVSFVPSDARQITVTSSAFPDVVELPSDLASGAATLAALEPPWARLVGAMITLTCPGTGGTITIESTLPMGSGLSSSAALAVAIADVFGIRGTPRVIAGLCQEAERRSGVPVGIMDPLVCAGGQIGHAMLIDFASLAVHHLPLPEAMDVVVVDSGQRRTLRTSGYADRVAECEAATVLIGPLGRAHAHDLSDLDDPVLRRRARHVITECERVRRCAVALVGGDLVTFGALMTESHRSLALDFDASTPALDALVDRLLALPGVYGARVTGAGFGGCVVAVSRPGAIDLEAMATSAWRVESSDGTVTARG